MAPYEYDEERNTWVPATPLGWQEEHGWVARLILWIRGVSHCDKTGRRDR